MNLFGTYVLQSLEFHELIYNYIKIYLKKHENDLFFN